MRIFDDNVYIETVKVPGTITSETIPSTYIDVTEYDTFVFKISIGATDNTVDAQVVQATDSAGTGSKNVTSAAITQLSGTDDNKHVTIQVDSEKLDIANGFRYVAVTLTVAGTTTGNVEFLGLLPRKAPVTQPAAYAEAVVIAG